MATQKGGCILIDKETKKVALVYRPIFNDYTFAKGHMEEGEDVKQCAIRETIEETGRKVKLIEEEPIFINRYITPLNEDVECYFYLAEDDGPYEGEIAEHDRELCDWYSIDEVEVLLTYDDVKEFWQGIKPKVEKYFNE